MKNGFYIVFFVVLGIKKTILYSIQPLRRPEVNFMPVEFLLYLPLRHFNSGFQYVGTF